MTETLTVTSGAIGPGPVMTEEVIEASFEVPQFDGDLGTLVAMEFTVSGNITSTAILFDLFGSGFGTVGSGFVQSVIVLAASENGPEFPEATLELFALNSTFIAPFGQASLLLNTTSALDVFSATDLDGAIGDGTFVIDFGMVGSFTGIPFGTLPQQAVTFGVDVEYFYLLPGEERPPETLVGTKNKDKLVGIAQNETLDGKGGDDVLKAGRGEDLVNGGKGNDKISGGTGQDTLNGGKGTDVIKGQAGNDSLSGGEGNDTAKGGTGSDFVYGDAGNDKLFGNGSNDVLVGGKGRDVIKGGDDDDAMDGGKGRDTLYGGTGSDNFYFSPGGGKDTVMDFVLGEDEVYLPDYGITFDQLEFSNLDSALLMIIDGDTEVSFMGLQVGDLTEDMFTFA